MDEREPLLSMADLSNENERLRARIKELSDKLASYHSREKHPEFHVPTGGTRGRGRTRRTEDARRLGVVIKRLAALEAALKRLRRYWTDKHWADRMEEEHRDPPFLDVLIAEAGSALGGEAKP